MKLHGFSEVGEFRVRLPEPRFPFRGNEFIDAARAHEISSDSSSWLGLDKLAEFFTPNFAKRNPLNIPGPFYGAETDNCLTGPLAAPANILVDTDGCEFVFKQPATPTEFRDVIAAAMTECAVGYGADGDRHWRLSLIREWWKSRGDIANEVGEMWCPEDSVRHWKTALQGAAKDYLEIYAYYVENGRPPTASDSLPLI